MCDVEPTIVGPVYNARQVAEHLSKRFGRQIRPKFVASMRQRKLIPSGTSLQGYVWTEEEVQAIEQAVVDMPFGPGWAPVEPPKQEAKS